MTGQARSVVTFRDAKHGATVLLDDGTLGELQWVNRDHTRATVRVLGRHYRIPTARIIAVHGGDQ